MKPRFRSIVTASFAALLSLPALAHAETAWFSMIEKGEPRTTVQEFIFAVTDPATIETLREEIASGNVVRPVIVTGDIRRGRQTYNPDWSFHYVPDTVRVVKSAIEVCAAAPTYIEDHIEKVGGAFLPDNRWCAWGGRLVREVAPMVD